LRKMRLLRQTSTIIVLGILALCIHGCSFIDSIIPPPPPPPPPPTPEQRRQQAEQLREAKKERSIAVRYFAPAAIPDENGDVTVFFIKQVTWRINLQDERRFYICSCALDGRGKKEISRLQSGSLDKNNDLQKGEWRMAVSSKTQLAVFGLGWYIVSSRQARIFVARLDGTKTWQLIPRIGKEEISREARCPGITLDGEWIVFEELNSVNAWDYSRIVRCHPDGTGYVSLTETNDYQSSYAPSLSPNGSSVAYVYRSRATNGSDHGGVMKADGSDKRDLRLWREPRWALDSIHVFDPGMPWVNSVTGTRVNGLPKIENGDESNSAMTVAVFAIDQGIGTLEVGAKDVRPLLVNVKRPANPGDIEKEDFRW